MQNSTINIIGGGLAGTECALQLAHRGFKVNLYELRDGQTSTPAHQTQNLAELVCSNSFGSMSEDSAPGELKWEAEQLGCFILKAAKIAQVPAGQALGADRQVFAQTLTDWVNQHPNITLIKKAIQSLDEVPRPTVVATGPLTSEALAQSLSQHFGGDFLYFFDAIAPIIDADSINTEIAWKASRYDKGTKDYFNCPMNQDEYNAFIEAVKKARKIEPKHFEITPFFEGCMPIEVMVDRGDQTLRFGPMKPVGLKDPRTGKDPYAVVQLRQDNKEATAYNMVGFQTRMAYGDQKEVFRLIPGLENAEFLKLGSIHRNLFINSPKLLNSDLSSHKDSLLFFAGQITGVEGYFESTVTGLLVSKFLSDKLTNRTLPHPPRASAMGSLMEAITSPDRAEHFQPTNINFGLFPQLTHRVRSKAEKKAAQIQVAREAFSQYVTTFC